MYVFIMSGQGHWKPPRNFVFNIIIILHHLSPLYKWGNRLIEIKLLVPGHMAKGADLNSSSSWSHPTPLTTTSTGNALKTCGCLAWGPHNEIARTSVSSLTFIPWKSPKFWFQGLCWAVFTSRQWPSLPPFHGHWLLFRFSARVPWLKWQKDHPIPHPPLLGHEAEKTLLPVACRVSRRQLLSYLIWSLL